MASKAETLNNGKNININRRINLKYNQHMDHIMLFLLVISNKVGHITVEVLKYSSISKQNTLITVRSIMKNGTILFHRTAPMMGFSF